MSHPKQNNNHVYAVMFVSSLKISKSPNHPQIDIDGNVLNCPILLAAKANNPNWSNQWIPLTSLSAYPDWSVVNSSTACASRNRIKRGLRKVYPIEPFYNMTFISGFQPKMDHFGESINDLRTFSKTIHKEIIGVDTNISDVNGILNGIIDYSLTKAMNELALTKEKFNHRLELSKLTTLILSKYLFSLVCMEKDFVDLYNPDHYSDLTLIEINDVFAVYSMALNTILHSPSIQTLINNYKTYAIQPVEVNL